MTTLYPSSPATRTSASSARPRALSGFAKAWVNADPGQVGAPMPGPVVSVSMAERDSMTRGGRLFTIEAMKMESAVYAAPDGTVSEVAAGAGTRAEAHDRVLAIEASARTSQNVR